ncbi:competence type IV pilus minor pilin ComGF [Pseudolactococcus carnosus]|uniref:competence type IV pilus minor pilin ComGF n=1 Tax=Pseudolactococcus carnosus TaxID=2749961 RepID=UPI001FB8D1FD|nr:competence type IV pilus minor pilin ComGF [Lactococcus carnosus]
MNCYKKYLKAFTLLESLVALLSISLSVLVIQGMTHLIVQEVAVIRQSRENEWQIFCNLLRREFETTRLEKVSQNFLYVSTEKGSRRYGMKAGADDFRKTNASGQGYQPLIFGVSSVVISAQKQIVTIKLTFKKGDERTFIYAFSKSE